MKNATIETLLFLTMLTSTLGVFLGISLQSIEFTIIMMVCFFTAVAGIIVHLNDIKNK
jgi:hypothetical protein